MILFMKFQKNLYTTVLILVPVLLVYLCAHDSLVGILEDEVIYQETAESLADHGTFTVDTLPGHPSITKYPPLYTCVLALVIKTTGFITPWMAQRAYILLQCVITGLLAYWLLVVWGKRLGLSPLEQFFGMGAIFFNYHVLMVFASPMSEALFMLFGVMLAYDSYPAQTMNKKRQGVICLLSAGLLLTRSIGISIIAGSAAAFFQRKQYRMLILLVVSTACFMGILKIYQSSFVRPGQKADMTAILSYYTSYHYHLVPYQNDFHRDGLIGLVNGIGMNAVHNLSNGVESLGEVLFPFYEESIKPSTNKPIIPLIAGGIVGCLFILGLLLCKEGRYLLYFLIPYLGMLLVWTWPFTGRFWVPVLPLVILGLRGVLLRFDRMGRWLFYALCLSTMIMNLPFVVGRMSVAISSPDNHESVDKTDPLEVREYKEYLAWLKEKSSEQPKMILLGGMNTMQKARQYGVSGAWLEAMNGPEPFLMLSVGAQLTPEEMEEERMKLALLLNKVASQFHDQPVFVVSDFTLNKRYRSYLDTFSRENGGIAPVFVSESGNIRVYRLTPKI